MSYVKIHCPHCGKELSIPEDAEKLVCMFCAKPIDAKTIRLASMRPETSENIRDVEALIPDTLFQKWLDPENFTAALYPDQYTSYLEKFRPALDAFRQYAAGDPGMAEAFAELLFRRFRAGTEGSKGKRKNSFAFRLTITALTIPSILSQQNEEADRAVDCFLKKWNQAFPGEHLGKATYDQILGGFRHKFCYITTAVCDSLGEGDDCAELNEFRAFRDGWLSHAPNGREKITEYYLFAPMIVRAINRSEQPGMEYRRIWKDCLSPLLQCLRSGREKECACGYEAMVRSLERKWL